MRDFQRAKAYKAERELSIWTYNGQDFRSVAEMQKYVDRLTSYKWFVDQFGSGWKITVKDGRGRRKACGAMTGARTGYVKMPLWSRSKLVLLHEVAHAINKRWDRHGPYWAASYILLVEKMLGEEIAQELRANFRKHNVDFSWR